MTPRLVLLVLACCLTGARGAGADYLIRSWDFEPGPSVRGLNCICLDREGFLWLGAKDGLVRFDGLLFQRQTFPDSTLLQGHNITAIWQARNGVLWLGCESGDLYTWDRHRSVLAAVPQTWEPQAVRSIACDGYGDVWLALASHDVVRVRDGWRLPAPPLASTEGTVQPLLLTFDGRLYQQEGAMIRLQGGTRDRPDWMQSNFAATRILRIAPSRKGGLWIYGDDQVRRWTEAHEWAETRCHLPPGTYMTRMIEAASGDLFAGTSNQGVLILKSDGTVESLSGTGSAVPERIVDLTEDPEGNILVCGDSRLHRIRLSRVQVVTSPDNWNSTRPVAVTEQADGTIWIGTEGSGLYRVGASGVQSLAHTGGLNKLFIWSLLNEPDGGLLVGTWGAGLFTGRDERFAPAPGWSDARGWTISALMRDRAGGIWAATNTGLWRQQDQTWAPVLDENGKPVLLVRYLLEDRRGRMWLATNGHGLGWYEAGRIRYLTAADGLPARFVTSLHESPDGTLWAATLGMGLYRLKAGNWAQVDRRHGLPADDIYHIADDRRGHLWFTSNIGVFALDEQELAAGAENQAAGLHPLILDRDDGLPSNYCSSGTQSAACMTEDGRFIVPTTRGVAILPTRSIRSETHRVTVRFTGVSVDDTDTALRGNDRIAAPPGTRRLAVEFTAPSFTNPERVHFRYQLIGLYPHWVDLGAHRSVLFSHLPPGSYSLRVTASNADGIWNPTPAVLDFSVAPYFWETSWFSVLAVSLLVATVAGTVWFVVHRRARRRLEQLERQQAIESERRRIAGDIHDQLGASLTQIMLLSQSTGSTPPVAGSPGLLSKVHAVALDITKSMDELVWAINPSHDTLESFAAYGARVTQEIAAASGLRARLHIDAQLPEVRLQAGVRHHLLLVLKEALTNVVRHAEASEVRLTLRAEGRQLILEVADNGHGFAPPLPVAAEDPPRRIGGHGIPNLRARATQLHGSLTLTSTPGQGTVLRLAIPLPH